MKKEKNIKKIQLNIAIFIGWLLFGAGISNFISYLIWACSQDESDKWFTRQFLSLMCFGFAGIIFGIIYLTSNINEEDSN